MAVFASDPMSSVAYGPEEVLLVLALAGAAGMGYIVPICAAIALLIWIVATSYRQTVLEYPSGGGAYVVARENLSPLTSHLAGAALLTDYIVSVAVAVSAGIAALTSAFPPLHDYRVGLSVGCVVLIALINLRGVRETAGAFALPVYGFIACAAVTIAIGLVRMLRGELHPVLHEVLAQQATLTGVSAFLLLRAFSAGCVSLTGLEALANGVQAFRESRGRRAATVMSLLAIVLSTTVVGVAVLMHHVRLQPVEGVTVLSQIGEIVFGRTGLYYALQLTTMAILVFAANSSFSGFPRLSAFMARDGYMPRQMANLGDRLVFQNGILVLAGLAIVLIVSFRATVTALIPCMPSGSSPPSHCRRRGWSDTGSAGVGRAGGIRRRSTALALPVRRSC